MKKFLLIISMMVSVSAMAQKPFSSEYRKSDVSEVCNAVASWQITHHPESLHPILDWTNGAMLRGMVEWGKVGCNQDCIEFVKEIGERVNWNMWDRPYHADDICVAQAFIEMYRLLGDPRMIRPAKERCFWVASHPSKAPLQKSDPIGADERWSWSDALFMAGPVYAALYSITGEKIYADFLDKEFMECTDSLFDKDESLYYRDNVRIPLREPNGAKQFWGRGNGWVFGALPLILQYLPENHPSRNYYLTIYKQMAAKIVKIMDENGAWHSSLLDPGSYPLPENSCSAFFCYGIAWGINSGVFFGTPKKRFQKALDKAWAQLVSGVHPDGKLGYIQPVGASPKGAVGMDATDIYGVGAFLLAGSEIYKMSK